MVRTRASAHLATMANTMLMATASKMSQRIDAVMAKPCNFPQIAGAAAIPSLI
jgi:hypothetical protein